MVSITASITLVFVTVCVPAVWLFTIQGVRVRRRGVLIDALEFFNDGGPRTKVFTGLFLALWLVSVGLGFGLGFGLEGASLANQKHAVRAVSAFAGSLSLAFMVNSILVF